MKSKLKILSFYRFIKINEKKKIKKLLEIFIGKKTVRGTILLSDEGVNGSLAGSDFDLLLIIKYLKKILKIKKLRINSNNIDFLPFNRLKIRLKKEIISMGIGELNLKVLIIIISIPMNGINS